MRFPDTKPLPRATSVLGLLRPQAYVAPADLGLVQPSCYGSFSAVAQRLATVQNQWTESGLLGQRLTLTGPIGLRVLSCHVTPSTFGDSGDRPFRYEPFERERITAHLEEKSGRESFMPSGPPARGMDNWMDMMTEAMTGDQTDVVATHRLLTQCQDAAMKEVQMFIAIF